MEEKVTSTETKFRNWAKKKYKGAYIKKIPDFKQMGSGAPVGLPDYMIVYEGETIWFEVKSGFGDTLNMKNHLTPAQKIVFNQFYKNGVNVFLYCFTKSYGPRVIEWSDLANNPKRVYKFTH